MKTQWVRAWAGVGQIPHVRLRRYRRFRESAVEAWLRKLEADSAAPKNREAPSVVARRRRAYRRRPTANARSPGPLDERRLGRRGERPLRQIDKRWTPVAVDSSPRSGRKGPFCRPVVESGRQDLNLRPPGPQPGALPDCATPRGRVDDNRDRGAGHCSGGPARKRATGVEPVPRAWKAPVQPLTPRPRVTGMVARRRRLVGPA